MVFLFLSQCSAKKQIRDSESCGNEKETNIVEIGEMWIIDYVPILSPPSETFFYPSWIPFFLPDASFVPPASVSLV